MDARRAARRWSKQGLKNRDFDHGRTTVRAQANCFACHRFDSEGGPGPDLTGLAGRFSLRDLLESIVDPEQGDQRSVPGGRHPHDRGQVVTGRIVNLHGDG